MRGKCSVPDCDRNVERLEWCLMHYKRKRKYGDPNVVKFKRRPNGLGFAEAVAFHSVREGEHLIWSGGCRPDGYAQLNLSGNIVLVYQEVWSRENGPVPHGMEIDHKCRNRACIDINHLRLVTSTQNKENLGLRRDNKSGYRGVSWCSRRCKWHAQVSHSNKTIHSSYHDDLMSAANAARRARIKQMTHNEADRC